MRYRRHITNRYKRYIYPAIINSAFNSASILMVVAICPIVMSFLQRFINDIILQYMPSNLLELSRKSAFITHHTPALQWRFCTCSGCGAAARRPGALRLWNYSVERISMSSVLNQTNSLPIFSLDNNPTPSNSARYFLAVLMLFILSTHPSLQALILELYLHL